MNLIEQLGGYERAKDGLHRLKLEKKDLLTCGDLVVVESEIDAALIEYRRQHNIFEVGDSVLPISNHSDQVYFLSDWYIEDLDFRYTTNSGSWGIIVKSLMDGAWRHATDAEIKAGKRLEVNQ